MSRNYLINETLNEGSYRLVEPLHLGPYRKLYLAARTHAPDQQFLASIVTVATPPVVEELRKQLAYQLPGVLELDFIGHFDIHGADQTQRSAQEGNWAMLERLPRGSWLRRLTTGTLGASAAVRLGLSVGDILLRAASHGVLLTDIRPDYIWAEEDDGQILATGLTARSERFFQCQSKHWTKIFFPHHYDSPDRRNVSVASLTFTLATMIAEWILGAYPFPKPGPDRLSAEQYEGRPPALPVTKPLAQVLQRAFTADPAHRPALAQFLAELKALRAEDLAI